MMFECVHAKSTSLFSVIPADAGIQATFCSFTVANLGAGMRRHDEKFTSPEGEDFNHPRVRHYLCGNER
jgi:hypothetical protein